MTNHKTRNGNKNETRKIAERLNLKVKNKPDSQDICFVPNGKYSDVVRRLRPGSIEPGNITYLDGSILGKHKGIIDYTIGQRRGLGIGGVSDLEEDRLYVVDINVSNNEVIVGPKEALNVDEILLKDMSWVNNSFPNDTNILVKLRNTGKLVPAELSRMNDMVSLRPTQPAEGVSPGQAAVIYDTNDENKVLGGGWIVSTASKLLKKYNFSSSVA